MQRGAVSIDRQFFSEQNEQTLFNNLIQDLQQKTGPLSRPQTNRLAKTLEHYMQEIWDVNGPMPIQQLNREVINATSQDYFSYLRRNEIAPTLAASEKIVSDPANQPRAEIAQQRLLSQQGLPVPARPTFESNLLMDTGSRFEQLQQERVSIVSAKPHVPDFQISLASTADEPSAISLYEKAKKMRDAEAARVQDEAKRLAGISNATGDAQTDVNPLARFMTPPSIQNDPQNNPTLAQPIVSIVGSPRGPLPQDFLIKQDDIVNYKEIEYNLVLYSADRDWLNSDKETRYNFSVLFDPGNTRHGFGAQTASTKKFKNITRIELVKAILPSEGLDNLVKVSSSSPSVVYDAASKVNVLNFPHILVRIPELDTNNYGTDNNLDNAFAVLQYDANWYTDTTNLSDGYLGMIPKFMKCQKVYQPTPLSTLTKLSIEFQRPNGYPLSIYPDTLCIEHIYQSGSLPGGYGYTGLYSNITDTGAGLYYIIQTKTYFSQWMFQPGNRIQIKGINPEDLAGGSTMAMTNLKDYLESEAGLLIVAIGYEGTTSGDGSNDVGYSNLIIVQAPMQDPTTGSESPILLGGSSATNTALADSLETTTFDCAKLINLTHQTNVVLRIITREMDPAARVRPDNL
jgi:hypothetical protein